MRLPTHRQAWMVTAWTVAAWIPDLSLAQPLPPAPATSILVDVSVSVRGEPLTGLRQEDFVVREDRTRRPISALSWESLPLDIVLVCPRTGPGRLGPVFGGHVPPGVVPPQYDVFLGQLVQFAAAVTLRVPNSEDRVALVSYGIEPRLELPFTQDRDAIATAIRNVGQSVKDTDVLEYLDSAFPHALSPPAWFTAMQIKGLAIDYAIQVLSEKVLSVTASPNRRKLIVMVTEIAPRAFDSYAGSPDEPVIGRLWDAGIVLTAAGLGNREPLRDWTRRQPVDATYRRNNPMHIAQATGGEALVPERPQDEKELEGVLARARQRYILTFDQPEGLAPGLERTITVDLSPEARKRFPDAVVRARQGYITR